MSANARSEEHEDTRSCPFTIPHDELLETLDHAQILHQSHASIIRYPVSIVGSALNLVYKHFQSSSCSDVARATGAALHQVYPSSLVHLQAHPNLIPILGLVVSKQEEDTTTTTITTGYVMPYFRTSLKSIIYDPKSSALTNSEMLDLLLQLTTTLTFLHARGWAHGRLSSAKCYLDCRTLKLLGSGQAQVLAQAQGQTSHPREAWETQDLEALCELVVECVTGQRRINGMMMPETTQGEKSQKEETRRRIDRAWESLLRACQDVTYTRLDQVHSALEQVAQDTHSSPPIYPILIRQTLEASADQAQLEQAQARAVSKRLEGVQHQCQALTTSLVEEQASVDALLAQVQILQAQHQTQDETIRTLTESNQELERTHRGIQDMKREHAQIVAQSQDQVQTKTQELVKAQSQIQSLEARVQSLHSIMASREQEQEAAQVSVSRAQAQAEAAEACLAQLQKEIQASNDRAREDQVGWQQALKRLEHETQINLKSQARVQTLVTTQKRLLKQNQDYHPTHGVKTLELKARQLAEVERLKQQSQEIQNHLFEREHQLENAHDQISNLQQVIRKQEDQRAEDRKTLEQVRDECTKATDQHHHQLIKIQTQEAMLHQQTQQIQALEQEIVDCREEMQRREEREAARQAAAKAKKCQTFECDAPSFLVTETGRCKDCQAQVDREAFDERQARAPETLLATFVTHLRLKFRPDRMLAQLLEYQHHAGFLNLALNEIATFVRECKSEPGLAFRDAWVEHGGVPYLIELLALHQADPVVLRPALVAIEVLVFQHEQNRVQFVSDKLLPELSAIMTRYATNPSILQRCCCVLTNVSHASESNCRRICLDLPNDPNDSSPHGPGNNLLSQLLEVMTQFPTHAGVQLRALWALTSLASTNASCQIIVSSGGLGAIVAAMLNCPANVEIQVYGCWALSNVVQDAPDVQAFARTEGVVEVCLAAMACFPDHDQLHVKAQSVLDLVCLAEHAHKNSVFLVPSC